MLSKEERQTCIELRTLLEKGLAENLLRNESLIGGANDPNKERDNKTITELIENFRQTGCQIEKFGQEITL